MFDQNLKEEYSRFKAEYITALKNFLHGDELAKGQKTLGFWAYDFKWIPVETISCIYENFLTGIDRKEKGACLLYTSIFDLEVVFLYPWAVNFRDYIMMNPESFTAMCIFIGILLVAYRNCQKSFCNHAPL